MKMKTLMTAIALTTAFSMMSHADRFAVRSDAKPFQPSASAHSPVILKTSQPGAAIPPATYRSYRDCGRRKSFIEKNIW